MQLNPAARLGDHLIVGSVIGPMEGWSALRSDDAAAWLIAILLAAAGGLWLVRRGQGVEERLALQALLTCAGQPSVLVHLIERLDQLVLLGDEDHRGLEDLFGLGWAAID